jgi:hypothetical protein
MSALNASLSQQLSSLNTSLYNLTSSISDQLSAGFRDISDQVLDLESVVAEGNKLILSTVQAEVRDASEGRYAIHASTETGSSTR